MGSSSGGGGGQASTSTIPRWAKAAHKDLINSAQDFTYGDRGAYQPVPFNRIAGFTGQELQSQGAREALFNRGDIAGQFAGNALQGVQGVPQHILDAGNQQFTSSDIQGRMNPYIDNVLNPQLREAEESFNRRLNQTDAQNIARGGSVGSYRAGLERALVEGNKAETLGDIRGQGMYSAYGDAQNSFYADRDAQMRGGLQSMQAATGLAGAADALGSGSQARNLSLINELERAGANQREMSQRELDLATNDFYEERDFPMQRMQFLSGILSGIPTGPMGQTQVQSAQPGLASQAASLGLSAASLQQLFSGGK